MSQFLAGLTVVALMGTAVYYVRLLVRGVKPAKPAPWIIFVVTLSLSMWTRVKSPNFEILPNIGNLAAVINVWTIFLGVMYVFFRDSGRKLGFTKFQWKMLAFSGLIVVFWAVTDNAFVSNILIQVLMVCGYWVNAEHMWRAQENTDPIFFWAIQGGATAVALYPAIMVRDWLAILYGTRATLCNVLTVVLQLRLEARKKRAKDGPFAVLI